MKKERKINNMLNRFLCLRPLSKNFKKNYNKKIKIRMAIMVTLKEN